VDDATVRSVMKVVFEKENEGQNLGDFLIQNPNGYNKLKARVSEVLSAIDELGLSVVDSRQYLPRKAVKMSRKGKRKRLKSNEAAAPQTRQEPTALARQRAKRRK